MSLVIGAIVFWLVMWWVNQRLVSIPTGTNVALTRGINLLVPDNLWNHAVGVMGRNCARS